MQVIKIKELGDGSATMTYELTKLERQMFKDQAKKKKVPFNDDFINSEILKCLEDACKEEVTVKKTKKKGK